MILARQNLADLVSIGITTKNRWHDLEITLNKIVDAGLGKLPILIFDDGSDEPCPFDIKNIALSIELKRFSESKGLIVRRNQLAQLMQTKYYLSLDDDSFPVAGSLEEAVRFAESYNNLLCVSFPIYNPVLEKYQSPSIQQNPYQVKFFVGCGHLLNRESFLYLGGYCEALIHQCEEMELAARGFQEGLYCYHFPGFEIHHTASNVARNWKRMDFYGARNFVLWNDWYVPKEIYLIKQFQTGISMLIRSIQVGRIGLIRGEFAGFKDILQYKINRKNMSLKIYRKWVNLHNT